MRKYNSASSSLRSGQLDRLVSKIKDKKPIEYVCDQCGSDTDALYEGYCWACCDENQTAIAEHNVAYDVWQKLNDEERDLLIKLAIRHEG